VAQTLVQDFLYAARSLRRASGFTTVAIGVLALGIASSTVVFSVINVVLLRSLPYPDAERLMVVHWEDTAQVRGEVSANAFFMLEEHTPSSVENVAAIYAQPTGVNLAGSGTPEYVRALRVSGGFFPTLGTPPVKGGAFQPEDDRANAPCTSVLSFGLWQRSFDKDPTIYGRLLRINGALCKVIGVMPQDFHSYPDADIWLPLQLDINSADPGSDYRVIVRLKNGATLERANLELRWLSDQNHLRYVPSSSKKGRLVLQPLQSFQVGGNRDRLFILFGAVIFLLLVACSEVAVMLLVRALSRSHEIAIRAALGSSRMRLARVSFLESMMLAGAASLLGIIQAKEVLPLIMVFAPPELPLMRDVRIDINVALFAIAISILTSLIAGMVPALRVSRVSLETMLREISRTASGGVRQARTGAILISAQAGLTLVLLSGSALLMRNYMDLAATAPGFDPRGVSVAQVSLPCQPYCTQAQTVRFIGISIARLKSAAGVEAAATVNGLPLEQGLNLPVAATEFPERVEHAAEFRLISDDYFAVMGTPLLVGRAFSPSDDVGSTQVAIINDALARRWWPNTSPIGHFVKVSDELGPQFSDAARQIVGVVADVRESGLERPTPPSVFIPVKQAPDKIIAFVNRIFFTSIVVRASDSTNVSREIRAAISSADPYLPVASLRPLTDVIRGSLSRYRFYALITGAFALFALILTALGLYALLNYQLSLRLRELAIRMALGAPRSGIIQMVVRQGLLMVSKGAVAGIAGVFLLKHVLERMVPNLESIDLLALFSAVAFLTVVAALASLMAAVRAADIEPMDILRNE
jgi:predicted permease